MQYAAGERECQQSKQWFMAHTIRNCAASGNVLQVVRQVMEWQRLAVEAAGERRRSTQEASQTLPQRVKRDPWEGYSTRARVQVSAQHSSITAHATKNEKTAEILLRQKTFG